MYLPGQMVRSTIFSPTILNHRALCSLNKRAANYASIGDTDWETPNADKSRYILNFGSNFMECHQGSIHLARRVAHAALRAGPGAAPMRRCRG